MKAFFLTALCALTLVACGGNQNNKTREPAAEPATEQDVQAAPVERNSEGIAFEAYKAICALDGVTVEAETPEDCTVSYLVYTDDIEGYYEETSYECFPLTGDGWLVIETWCGAAEGEATGYISTAYGFINGELEELEGCLPIPAFDEVFDEDAVDPGNLELIPRIKAIYRERPEDFLAYHANAEDGTLTVELRPRDPYAEESTGDWLECYWEYRHDEEEMPLYHWDGKAFVK